MFPEIKLAHLRREWTEEELEDFYLNSDDKEKYWLVAGLNNKVRLYNDDIKKMYVSRAVWARTLAKLLSDEIAQHVEEREGIDAFEDCHPLVDGDENQCVCGRLLKPLRDELLLQAERWEKEGR